MRPPHRTRRVPISVPWVAVLAQAIQLSSHTADLEGSRDQDQVVTAET